MSTNLVKSKSEMMKRLYHERKEKGLVLFKEWMTEEHAAKTRAFVESLKSGENNTGKSHELARELLLAPNSEVQCSVDISTGQDDADRRCFGDLEEIGELPSNIGFGSDVVMLLFSGSLNK